MRGNLSQLQRFCVSFKDTKNKGDKKQRIQKTKDTKNKGYKKQRRQKTKETKNKGNKI